MKTNIINNKTELVAETGWLTEKNPIETRNYYKKLLLSETDSEDNYIEIKDMDSMVEIEKTKQTKLEDIEQYDKSDSVNSFIVNGKSAWLTPEVRGNYKTSIDAAELLGETSISLLIADIAATLTINNAKMMLAQIQRYADACYLVTMTHKATVNALTDIDSVDSYDITSNYPPKLTFTL